MSETPSRPDRELYFLASCDKLVQKAQELGDNLQRWFDADKASAAEEEWRNTVVISMLSCYLASKQALGGVASAIVGSDEDPYGSEQDEREFDF